MEDWQLGLILMSVAAISLGARAGFQIVNAKAGDFPVVTFCVTAFFYYWGALILATVSTEMASGAFVYALATVVVGLFATAAATFLWFLFFKKFNQFVKWYNREVLNNPR